ncbi:MAG: CcmD family protein [Candidatus Zixiibacteriota bacterium]
MNGNYIAMIATLVVWIGLFIILLRLDKRVRKLEKKLK